MKKTFLLAASLALCFSQSRGQASVTNDVSAYMYSIDNVTHCQVLNGSPGSQVEFYSERWGGKLIKQENIGASGTLEIAEKGFSPAFVINKKSNRVFFMEPIEFSLEKIQLKSSGNSNRVSWEGTVNPDKELIFQVLKSKDGINYAVLERIPAKSADKAQYAVDDAGTESSYYKIKVVNQKEGVRYSSPPMKLGAKDVVIYPSLVATSLIIDVLSDQAGAVFAISNISGQVVKSGKLSQGTNTVNLAELSSGSYIVNVSGGTLKASEKITKQ